MVVLAYIYFISCYFKTDASCGEKIKSDFNYRYHSLYIFGSLYKVIVHFDIIALDWTIDKVARLGTSFMPFVWGMLFYKYQLFTKLKIRLYKKFSNKQIIVAGIIIFIIIIVCHGLFESAIVAPFTGLCILTMFNIIKKSDSVNRIFGFLGEHSTNIWLTHMFFYYDVLFNGVVFLAKYPIFIFAFMMVLTIGCSYIINLIYKPILKLIK